MYVYIYRCANLSKSRFPSTPTLSRYSVFLAPCPFPQIHTPTTTHTLNYTSTHHLLTPSFRPRSTTPSKKRANVVFGWASPCIDAYMYIYIYVYTYMYHIHIYVSI